MAATSLWLNKYFTDSLIKNMGLFIEYLLPSFESKDLTRKNRGNETKTLEKTTLRAISLNLILAAPQAKTAATNKMVAIPANVRRKLVLEVFIVKIISRIE